MLARSYNWYLFVIFISVAVFLAYQVCRSAKPGSTKWTIIWFRKHTFWWSGFAVYPSPGEYVFSSMFCPLLYIMDRMKLNSTSAELNVGYLFFCLQTRPHATVEVEISEDMQLVHFDFNRWCWLLLWLIFSLIVCWCECLMFISHLYACCQGGLQIVQRGIIMFIVVQHLLYLLAMSWNNLCDMQNRL